MSNLPDKISSVLRLLGEMGRYRTHNNAVDFKSKLNILKGEVASLEKNAKKDWRQNPGSIEWEQHVKPNIDTITKHVNTMTKVVENTKAVNVRTAVPQNMLTSLHGAVKNIQVTFSAATA